MLLSTWLVWGSQPGQGPLLRHVIGSKICMIGSNFEMMQLKGSDSAGASEGDAPPACRELWRLARCRSCLSCAQADGHSHLQLPLAAPHGPALQLLEGMRIQLSCAGTQAGVSVSTTALWSSVKGRVRTQLWRLTNCSLGGAGSSFTQGHPAWQAGCLYHQIAGQPHGKGFSDVDRRACQGGDI